jgi:parvulin-like peptidyl-prolyl isomerase
MAKQGQEIRLMLRSQLLALAMLVVFGVAAETVQGADAGQGVVATVGKATITEEDVQREIQKRLPMQVSFHGGIKPERLEKIKAEAKDEVIARAYKVQYAQASGIALDAGAVDAEWAAILAKNPKAAEAAPQEIAKFKAALGNELLAKKAEDAAVNARVQVTDADVRQYYETNKDQYFQPKLFKASHVFVKVNPSATPEEKAALQQRAEKLMERARAGEDFYNLAYYESDDRSRYVGGSLGSFHAGQTVREFDAALQQMKPGEIAGPVQTLYGYHIIRLDDVQEARQLTFDEAAERIRSRLKEERRKQLYEEWMAGLRQQYPLQAAPK